MSTFRNPVGPQSPQVYWRRRLLVGLGALAVLVVVLLIIFRPGADASNDNKKPATETTSTTEATNEPVQEEGADCVPANVEVTAVTDKTEYASGQQPMISMSIVNNGPVACVMSVGTDQQLYQISSGSETYWKSTDCQSAPAEQKVALEPGVPQSTTPIPWDRTRSSAATCTSERPPVTAEGASYHLTVSLGELKPEKTAQFLLR